MLKTQPIILKFFPSGFILLGTIYILLSKNERFIKWYNKINKKMFSFLRFRIYKDDELGEEYTRTQLFGGGIMLIIIGIIAQIYFFIKF